MTKAKPTRVLRTKPKKTVKRKAKPKPTSEAESLLIALLMQVSGQVLRTDEVEAAQNYKLVIEHRSIHNEIALRAVPKETPDAQS